MEEEFSWRPHDLQSKLMRLRSQRAAKAKTTTGLKEGVRVNRGDGLQVLATEGQAAVAAAGIFYLRIIYFLGLFQVYVFCVI